MKQLSICLVSQEYPEETGWGGIGTYTSEIAHGLARAGHRVCVVSRALRHEQRYHEADDVMVYRILPRLKTDRIPLLWRLNRIWEGYHLAVAFQLQRLAREQKIDVIEAPGLHGETALFRNKRCRIPAVIRLHSCLPKTVALNETPYRLPLHVSHWLERYACTRAQGLTAPSKSIVRDNLPYLPIKEQQVAIVPNPIDTVLFTPSETKLEDTQPTVLFVGRLEQRKGAHVLGQAMPLVWARHPKTRFLFVGADARAPSGGSMAQWLGACAPKRHRDQVVIYNRTARDNLPLLYQRAMLVVFPSCWEPFGYVCVEAMACGKALIATRAGGPEEIITDRQTGLLVPPNDPGALAERILELLDDRALRIRLGRAARELVLARYDTCVVSRQMAEIYSMVLEKKLSWI